MPPPPPRSEIDHTKRPLLTHMPPPPPKDGAEKHRASGWGRGIRNLPTPHGEPKKVAVEEPLLFGHRKMYYSTKKERQTTMMDQPETYTN